MNLIEHLKSFKATIDTAETDVFFRLGDADENLLETASVEIATGRGFESRETVIDTLLQSQLPEFYELSESEIAEERERFLESFDSYDPRYPDNYSSNLLWNEAGYRGAGFYYNGVCCCDSLEALADYVNTRHWGDEDSVIFVFEGQDNGDCNDGDVATPIRQLRKMHRSILENPELVEILDAIAAGDNITVGGEEI